LGYKRGDFPTAERCAEQVLSLPMYAELTPEMVEKVAATVLEFAPPHPSMVRTAFLPRWSNRATWTKPPVAI
jgi:hypothetical protein